LKTAEGSRPPWVRIPPSPPNGQVGFADGETFFFADGVKFLQDAFRCQAFGCRLFMHKRHISPRENIKKP
jgi:hypothetical protein